MEELKYTASNINEYVSSPFIEKCACVHGGGGACLPSLHPMGFEYACKHKTVEEGS